LIKSINWIQGIFILFLILPVSSFSQITFERTYGGINTEESFSVQQTFDSGYIIAGYTESFGTIWRNIYTIKTDSLGDTLWTKMYGGTDYDVGYSVLQTLDGGYIIAGATSSFGAGGYDVYLIKTDSLGDTLWTRTFGGVNDDFGYSLQQTADGGYIITGCTKCMTGAGEVYLIKTDSFGDTLWTRTYDNFDIDEGRSVQQTSDGGYIIAGWTWLWFPETYAIYLIKTDSLGSALWTRTYGGSWDEGWSVQQTSDEGYIIAATGAFYLLKTDSIGDIVWTKNCCGANIAAGRSVQQTLDGGYIITGNSGSGIDVYLIKTDSLGDTLWTKTFGGVDIDLGWSVKQTSDEGFIIAGRTGPFLGPWDFYLIKTDANGHVVGMEEDSSSIEFKYSRVKLLQNQPNPFNWSTVIEYSLSVSSSVTLNIYDLTGRLVKTLVEGPREPGHYSIGWNGKDDAGRQVASGVYFYRLKAGDFVDTKRLILLR
jgi:hypothetical protein